MYIYYYSVYHRNPAQLNQSINLPFIYRMHVRFSEFFCLKVLNSENNELSKKRCLNQQVTFIENLN